MEPKCYIYMVGALALLSALIFFAVRCHTKAAFGESTPLLGKGNVGGAATLGAAATTLNV